MSDPVVRLNAALEGRYSIERELGAGGWPPTTTVPVTAAAGGTGVFTARKLGAAAVLVLAVASGISLLRSGGRVEERSRFGRGDRALKLTSWRNR